MRPIDAFLQILREEQVTRVFGNPGTSELPFTDALIEAPDIDYVLGVHEGSVVAMADGYARATGRPAFVSLHIAAGLANGLVGLLNASRSRTPLVVTAGQQDRRHLASDPMLSGDLVGLARAAVKQTFDVQHAHDLPIMLRRAFALATQPPAGPVFLSIPMDLLEEPGPVHLPARSARTPLGPATGLETAADILKDARCPAIVAGDGVGREGATAELVGVAEALGAVVHQQPMYDGINFPGSHPLYRGMLPATNAGIRERLSPHDVVFIVGTHAFMAHHYTPGPAVPETARVLQLDSDPSELGRNFPVMLGLHGGITATLAKLHPLLAGRVPQAARRMAEAERKANGRRVATEWSARAGYDDSPLSALTACHALAAGLPEDAVVVEEAITAGIKLREVLTLDRPKSYVHTVGGGLGWGIGAAVGTWLGDPERPVVAVLGDGCTMFGLQGLWAASRLGAAVTFVVMNNGEYRTLKDTLDTWDSRSTHAGRYVGLDLAPPRLDFTKAADFFGIESMRVGNASELTRTVHKTTRSGAPFLIEVPVAGHSSPLWTDGGSRQCHDW